MKIEYKSNFLKKSRGLRHVVRYVQNPRIKDQSVAAHSYYVVLITKYLCDLFKLDDRLSYEAVQEALFHDIGESISLDMPSNVKRKNRKEAKKIEDSATKEMILRSTLDTVSRDEVNLISLIVKIADLLDVVFHCSEEISMGNSFFIPIMAEAIGAINNNAKKLDDKIEVINVQGHIYGIISSLINAQEAADLDMESMTHIHKNI
jgi:5'-deoxynucleotidase YfbR-like HD superfamily hydrolase